MLKRIVPILLMASLVACEPQAPEEHHRARGWWYENGEGFSTRIGDGPADPVYLCKDACTKTTKVGSIESPSFKGYEVANGSCYCIPVTTVIDPVFNTCVEPKKEEKNATVTYTPSTSSNFVTGGATFK